MTRALAPLAFLALVACADTDGDGLSDHDEKKLGTDPAVADSDGDGLDDGAEVNQYTTNPAVADSDGDGYDDGVELSAGTDPTDWTSVIYKGGWPFNPNKAEMNNPGFGHAGVGDQIGELVGPDQFAEDVDIYDFAHQGKPVIIDISAQWCPPCRETAKWLSGRSDSMGLTPYYGDVLDAVNNGDIYWVTVLVEKNNGDPATAETAAQWDEAYPNEHIAVLADGEYKLFSSLQQSGFPSFHMVDENMVLVDVNNPDQTTLDFGALDAAKAWLAAN